MLDAHPDVVESAVFGIPDEEWGQRVVAAYVGTAEPADLAAWARERLAPAKRPKSLHRLDDAAPHLHRQGAPAGPARGARSRRCLRLERGLGRRRRRRRDVGLRAGRPARRRRAPGAAAGGRRRPRRGPRTSRPSSATPPRCAPPSRASGELGPRGELTAGLTVPVPRGRVVGGSSALNAGSFIRATPRGPRRLGRRRQRPVVRRRRPARLPAAGGRPRLRRPARPRRDGPVPVHPGAGAAIRSPTRSPPPRPNSAIPAEPDKNAADAPPGYGPVPLNVADGVRVNTAMAYLSPRRGLPALTVRGGVTVRRVVVEHGRAVGVDDRRRGVVRAAEVVLCAGAVGSPHLLLLSGIGPADDLRRAGIDVVADVPGCRGGLQRPPERLRRLPAGPPAARAAALPLHGVLHATSAGASPGDLEILPWLTPFSRITGGARGPARGRAGRRCRPAARGQPGSAAAWTRRRSRRNPPRLAYGYLAEESDRRRLREGVRLAAELLRDRALAPLVAGRTTCPTPCSTTTARSTAGSGRT